jgi:dimethylglycine dehydrogenase
MRLAKDRFQIVGSGYLQNWHMRWFAEHLDQEGVQIRNISDEYSGLALIGPNSRELLARVAGLEVRDSTLSFMAVTEMNLALAPAIVGRLSVTGERGYEIYVPTLHLSVLLDAVMGESSGLGARHIGMYALNSLRLEKSFGIWSREFSPDYTPRMSGLDRFISYDKPAFIGRDAALRDRDSVPGKRLVTLAVQSPEADAAGYEPIWLGSKIVGFVTSGGYGHCSNISLAMGYLQSTIPDGQTGLSISILGEQCECRILTQPPIDPTGACMRG